MFRLGLINPNTDQRHTDSMGEVARTALPEGCQVTAVTAARGPSSIESEADSAVAAAEVVQLVRALPEQDAYLISCFGDPGLDAARELAHAPVVGIGEAAYLAASLISSRFAVVTTLRRGVPALEDALERRGLRSRCVAVAPLGIPVAEQGAAHPDTTSAIVELARRLAAEQGAEALVLACGGMADTATAVQDGAGVPAVDGVAFGATLAFGLWRCGLRTSKTGAYAWPEPIPYAGMQELGETGG
ncbi:MAG: aspartate/glutamate racemase family protein [Gaiellales bacterium]